MRSNVFLNYNCRLFKILDAEDPTSALYSSDGSSHQVRTYFLYSLVHSLLQQMYSITTCTPSSSQSRDITPVSKELIHIGLVQIVFFIQGSGNLSSIINASPRSRINAGTSGTRTNVRSVRIISTMYHRLRNPPLCSHRARTTTIPIRPFPLHNGSTILRELVKR
jgi:hypothetical protein